MVRKALIELSCLQGPFMTPVQMVVRKKTQTTPRSKTHISIAQFAWKLYWSRRNALIAKLCFAQSAFNNGVRSRTRVRCSARILSSEASTDSQNRPYSRKSFNVWTGRKGVVICRILTTRATLLSWTILKLWRIWRIVDILPLNVHLAAKMRS